MAFQAGEAIGVYKLDISDAKKSANELRSLFAQIKKDQDALGKTSGGSKSPFAPLAQDALKTQTALQKLAQQQQKTADATNKTALSAQKLATEQQRTVASATNASKAQQQLARDTANAAAAQDRAAITALRRRQAEERAAKQAQNGGLGPALPRTFAGFTAAGAAQAAGAFGLATLGPQLVGQAIRAGAEAGKASLALDRTLKLTKELTGTQALYNQVITTARTQQELYGASLQENISGIQGLVVTARSTGAELTTLINLSQRLAVLDPAQGAEGARIALSEVLSGDPRSLSRRYEIPLSALEKIKDESIPVADRLAILDKFLAKIGITSEVAANSVTDQAKAYNRLGAELGDLQTNTGRGLADFFAKPADGLGRLIGLINQNPKAIAELKALLSRKDTITPEDITAVQREQAASQADLALAPANTPFNPFASEKTRQNPDQLVASIEAGKENQAVIQNLKSQIIELNLANGEGAEKAKVLADQFAAGTISAQQFAVGIQALTDKENAGRDPEEHRIRTLGELGKAHDDLIAKVATFASGAKTAADASALDAANKDLQQIATNKVAFETNAAATAFLKLNPNLDASQGFALAAEKGLSPLVQQIIALRIEADKTRAALLGEKLNAQTSVQLTGALGDEGSLRGDLRQGKLDQRAAAIAKAQADAAAAEKARIDQLFRTGTATQVVAERQKEYNAAVKQFGANSAQAITAQTALIEAQKSANKPGKSPLNADFKADLKLSDDLIERLKVLEDKLKTLKVGSAAYKDVLAQIRDVKEKINDENEKELDLVTSIALAKVKDRQSLRDEQRETTRLQRVVGNSRFSPEVQAAAQDRLDEINLEQAKRKRDILRQERQAGKITNDLGGSTQIASSNITGNVLATSAGIPSTPVGSTPQIAAGAPTGILNAAPVTVNITLNIDKNGNTSVTGDPNAIVNMLLGSGRTAFNSGGAGG